MTDIVDAHGHVWTAPDQHEWVTDSYPGGTTGLVYELDRFREECTKTGADCSILVATPHHGPGSPYVRECVSANDDLYGIVTMDHTRDDAADRAATLLDARGVVGMRFDGDDLDEIPDGVWDAFAEADAQAQVLLGVANLPAVERLADEHPDVTVVLDHLGARYGVPADDDAYARLASIAEYPDTYVKVTSTPSDQRFPHEDLFDHVRRLLDWFGSERLLWGSDYVYRFRSVTPWQTREWLGHVPATSDRDRRMIEGKTALELLGE